MFSEFFDDLLDSFAVVLVVGARVHPVHESTEEVGGVVVYRFHFGLLEGVPDVPH